MMLISLNSQNLIITFVCFSFYFYPTTAYFLMLLSIFKYPSWINGSEGVGGGGGGMEPGEGYEYK